MQSSSNGKSTELDHSNVFPLSPQKGGWVLGQLESREQADTATASRYLVRVGEQRLSATVHSSVEEDLLDVCLANGSNVVLTMNPPVIVGALQTSVVQSRQSQPQELVSDRRVTLRAGKSAIILHADGTIELSGQQLKLTGQSAVALNGGSVALP